MYYDHRDVGRRSFKYSYTGAHLQPFAQKKLAEYERAETTARALVAKLLTDRTVSADSRELTAAKEDIEFNAKQAEECSVHVHEFARTPDRDFHLFLGDVVFFGLID